MPIIYCVAIHEGIHWPKIVRNKLYWIQYPSPNGIEFLVFVIFFFCIYLMYIAPFRSCQDCIRKILKVSESNEGSLDLLIIS